MSGDRKAALTPDAIRLACIRQLHIGVGPVTLASVARQLGVTRGDYGQSEDAGEPYRAAQREVGHECDTSRPEHAKATSGQHSGAGDLRSATWDGTQA